jgi:hypothetical protein
MLFIEMKLEKRILFFSVCAEEEEEVPLDQRTTQTRATPTLVKTEVKTEYDIDE